MSEYTPVNLGLTEFISKLIEETFDAIIVSCFNQNEKINEIDEGLTLSISEFSSRYIDDKEVELTITELFGYNLIETRKIIDRESFLYNLKKLEINITLKEIEKGTLSINLLNKLKEAVKLKLGLEKQTYLRLIMQKGIPKVIIRNGEINAKVNFNTLQLKDVSSTPAKAKGKKAETVNSTDTILLSKFSHNSFITQKISQGIFPDVKLSVTQVQNVAQTTGSSIGEITIRFETII